MRNAIAFRLKTKLSEPKAAASSAGSASKSGRKTSSSKALMSTPSSLNKPSQDLVKCCGCGVRVVPETKALQCDRCEGMDTWKCIQCLGIPSAIYELLQTGECNDLKWFCGKCEDQLEKRNNTDTLTRIEVLLEKLVEKTSSIDMRLTLLEIKLNDKAEKSVVEGIAKRLSDIELSLRAAAVSEKESTEDQIDESKNVVNESLDELKDRDARKENLESFSTYPNVWKRKSRPEKFTTSPNPSSCLQPNWESMLPS